ncbi:SDR family NAD(P)-dependent oxidoreductase [Dictyobacter aurantiacus]|uniref:Short-chain dehydrogenase n=1 Tax=Dictyobacter aurantiacus TaxID=1936993 RepID=A0A401ZMU0_9CHLR|nr:SDR family oxidoreductase [Dictyobacter aurantiacus]GCE08179.1 short-chain dehydrogenase [Dictyobacter aurantiacus]
MLLEKKNAIIYGAGGAVGGAIARAFAREGARVFLTGRTRASLDAVAEEIAAEGGEVETAQVDALDEQAIETHADAVVRAAGGIDISVNAIRVAEPGIYGIPVVELSPERFTLPVTAYLSSHFLTTRAAARRMIETRSGVIVTITGMPARAATPGAGGVAVAWAGIEALTRGLAAELGPLGIRAVCLRSNSIPETTVIREGYNARARATGQTPEQIQAVAEATVPLKRLPTLADLANVATFMASDQARAMTATVANLSGGLLADS